MLLDLWYDFWLPPVSPPPSPPPGSPADAANAALIGSYLNLITTEHVSRPRFVATVSLSVAPAAQVHALLNGLIEGFDINTAVGVQLDTIGQWVGQSRQVRIPLVGVYFAWDDLASDGWDSGSWQGPFDPVSGLTSLPDDAYRLLLLATISGNRWNGSGPAAEAILAQAFGPSTIVAIEDHQDMTVTVAVSGTPLSAVNQALLVQGSLQIRPMGVGVKDYLIIPATGVLLAWDIPANSVYAGWDSGQWGKTVLPV